VLNESLTVADFWLPRISHRYRIWYFRGKMSRLVQVGGGDHSTSRPLVPGGETRTSTGGSGFTEDGKQPCSSPEPPRGSVPVPHEDVLSPMSSSMKLERRELLPAADTAVTLMT